MLRRFSWLAVLLLTLSVIAPAVLACNSDDGCCPTQGAPCGPEGNEAAACRAEQPIAVALTTSVRELHSLDSRAPQGAAPAIAMHVPVLHASCFVCADAPQSVADQQQLYLQTGRLRL